MDIMIAMGLDKETIKTHMETIKIIYTQLEKEQLLI